MGIGKLEEGVSGVGAVNLVKFGGVGVGKLEEWVCKSGNGEVGGGVGL